MPDRTALGDFFGLLKRFVDRANHVERLLRQVIALTSGDHLETADGFRQRHVLAWGTGKHQVPVRPYPEWR